MLQNYLKIAFRNLMFNRIYTLISITGLAVGMMIAIFIFLWIRNEWSFDQYHADADRIYRITNHFVVSTGDTWHWGSTPYLLGAQIKAQIPEVEQIARISGGKTKAFKINENIREEKNCAFVEPSWFEVFEHDLIAGSIADFFDLKNSLMVTEDASNRLFGTTAVLGQTVIMDDTTELVVKAVLKNPPSNSSFKSDIFLPVSSILGTPNWLNNDGSWNNSNYHTFIKVKSLASIDQIESKIESIFQNHKEDRDYDLRLQQLSEMYFDTLVSDRLPKGNASIIKIFLFIGITILIIAGINYVNLATARTHTRSKETSIRKIVGANRGQLLSYFLTESILIVVISAIIGMALLNYTLPIFNQLFDVNLTLHYTDTWVWITLICVVGISVLIAGIYPSIILSAFQPIQFLQKNSLGKNSKQNFWKGLIIFQFCISIVLVISTIVIYQQQQFTRNKRLAFDNAQVLSVMLPIKPWLKAWRNNSAEQLLSFQQSLEANNSIVQSSYADYSKMNIDGRHSGSLDWPGKAPDYMPSVAPLSIDESYPAIFDLKLKEGRWLEAKNEDFKNVILNETAIKAFDLELDQEFSFKGNNGRIVGVVEDFHFNSLREAISPLVIHKAEFPRRELFIKIRPQKTKQAITDIENVWKQYFSNHPFVYAFADAQFNKLYKSEIRLGQLFRFFTTITLFLACLGLYGLSILAAHKKTKEIGIRKVLGASC